MQHVQYSHKYRLELSLFSFIHFVFRPSRVFMQFVVLDMGKYLTTLLPFLYLQLQTSGSSQQSVVIFLQVVLHMGLSAMARGCWSLVEWLNMENTAMISMSFR